MRDTNYDTGLNKIKTIIWLAAILNISHLMNKKGFIDKCLVTALWWPTAQVNVRDIPGPRPDHWIKD